MRHRWGCAGILFGLIPLSAFADGEALPTITVTEPQPAPDLSTVEAAAIDASPSASLTGLLRLVPGVHIDRAGAVGGVSSLYLRGAEPNYTAVLIDGVKANDPTNTRGGSFDFSSLTRDDIERIEVLRGPASALFGADALAGVLNIVSARGRGPAHAIASLGTGEHGFSRARAALRGSTGEFDYALGGGFLEGGHAAPGNEARIGDGNANVGWAPDPDSEMRLTTRYTDAQLASFPEDSGGWRYAVRRELERRDVAQRTTGVAAAQALGEDLFVGLRLGRHRRDEAFDSPGVAPGPRDLLGIPASTGISTFARDEAGITIGGVLAGTTLRAGVQGTQEHGVNDTVLALLGAQRFELARNSGGAFLDIDHAHDSGLRLEASARVDHADGYGNVTTPRVRISQTLGLWEVAVGGGRGFKLPSFFALGHPIVGNPELRPEHGRAWEAAVTRATGAGTLSLTLFDARYRDAIDFEEGPPPRLVNRDSVSARGAELGTRWDLGGQGHIRAHAAYVDARIDNSTEPLRNRPRWTGGAQLRYLPLPQVQLVLGAVHVGRNADSSIATGDVELPSYTRLDAGAGWDPWHDLGFRLDLENALDADYDEMIGFPGAARTLRFTLRAAL